MSSTPPEAPGGPAPQDPGDGGPRVTREEAKDLGRIRRSRSDRKVAGVAAGIARHLDIDPLLVRVAFVLLVFFGGAGLLLYGACWLFVPEEDTEDAVIRVDHGTRTVILAIAGVVSLVALLGDSLGDWHFPWQLALVGVIVAIVLASKGKLPAPPTSGPFPPPTSGPFAPPPGTPTGVQEPGAPADGADWTSYPGYRPPPPPAPVDRCKRGPLLFFFTFALAALLVGVVATLDLAGADIPVSAYPATVLATYGVMLLIGSVYGRAGGLILVGLVAAVATAATTAVDDVSIGQVSRTPTSAAELDDSYELGIGEIVLDLREIEDLQKLDGRTIRVDASIGHIEVILPDSGLDVVAQAEISEGRARVFDRDEEGGGTTNAYFEGGNAPETPTLTIDAELKLGEIEIHAEEVGR